MSENRPPFDELAGPLRRAVEQVRSEPVPEASLERAVARARLVDRARVSAAPPSRWQVLAGAALAAAMLLSIGLYYRHRSKDVPPPPNSDLARRPTAEPTREATDTPHLGLPVQGTDSRLGEVRTGGSDKAPRPTALPDTAAGFQPARPVAFAPGGRLLATTGGDRPVRLGQSVERPQRERPGNIIHLWDLAEGGLGRRIKVAVGPPPPGWLGQEGWIDVVALSPDGRRLAASANGVLRVWDTASGKELYHKASLGMVLVFSPDGKVLAVQESAGRGHGTVRLCEAITGKELRRVKGQGSFLPSVAFSADGKCLASASDDSYLRVWDVATGRAVYTFPQGHAETVAALAISPDRKLLASSGSEGTVRLWDLAADRESHRLSLRQGGDATGWATSLAFSPDGKLLAVGSTGGIRLWDTATGREARRFAPESGRAGVLTFSPDGKTLAGVREPYAQSMPENGKLGVLGLIEVYPTVFLWEVATGQERHHFAGKPAAPAQGPGLWQGKTTGLGWAPAAQGGPPAPHEVRQLWDDLRGGELPG